MLRTPRKKARLTKKGQVSDANPTALLRPRRDLRPDFTQW